MLNEPFLRVLGLMNGKSVEAYLSDCSGVSRKTLGKPLAAIRDKTLEKGAVKSFVKTRQRLDEAGYTLDEAENWLANHPGATMRGAICSSVGYDAQINGVMSFPWTIEYACHIDHLSLQLFDARSKGGLEGFKSALLCSDFAAPAYYLRTSEEGGGAAKPPLLRQLESASRWSELDEVWPTIVANVTFSLLAHWDVEFCSRYFAKYEPRSIFALVLPRLNQAVDSVGMDDIPKRRDMFWYPVRRLIDVMACMGERARTGAWPKRAPKPKEIERYISQEGSTLTNWRDGTKKFVGRDFYSLWEQMCSPRQEYVGRPPLPLFYAALIWQELLVEVSATTREKKIYLFDNEYKFWWNHHYEALMAKGCTVGTTPWPECFSTV